MNQRQQTIEGVSVIIPTYNRARCIMDAVRSAVAQDPPPLEVVVVDDGSVDETGQLVERFDHPLVRYVWQENTGLSGARNAGLALARGDLIAFLDSDDVWLEGKLAAQVRLLREDPGCDLVFTDMCETWQKEVVFDSVLHGRGYKYLAEGFLYENLLHENFIIPSSVMVRRRALEACGGFDETLRSSEDRDLWLRLSERGRIRFVDSPLCMRHRDTDGLTGDLDGWMSNQLRMFEKHLARRKRRRLGAQYAGRGPSIVRQLEENIHRSRSVLAEHCLRNLETARARKLVFRCLRRRVTAGHLVLLLAAHLPRPLLRRIKDARSRRVETASPGTIAEESRT